MFCFANVGISFRVIDFVSFLVDGFWIVTCGSFLEEFGSLDFSVASTCFLIAFYFGKTRRWLAYCVS